MFTTTELETLNRLLAQDTYQNMTDEEIDLLIEYKVEQKFFEKTNAFDMALRIQEYNARIEDSRATIQQTTDMLKSLCEENLARCAKIDANRNREV